MTRLKEIAPTYSIDAFDGKSWLVHFKDTADALGRTKEYDAWMAKYEKRIAEVKASIGAKATDTVVAPVSYWDGKVSSSYYSGVECQAFDDLGLTVYPGAKAKGGEGVALSSEQVGQLSDIDLAFAIKGPGDKGQKEFDAILKTLAKNKLWSALPFVKNDHYATYDMVMTYGSPSGQMAFLDVVEQAFKDV